MYCTNCGASLSGGERFCPNCGEKVMLFTGDSAFGASGNEAAFRQAPTGAEAGQNPVPGTGSAGEVVPENVGTSPENGNAAGQVYEAEYRREMSPQGAPENASGTRDSFHANVSGGAAQNAPQSQGYTQNPQGQGNAPVSDRQQNPGGGVRNPQNFNGGGAQPPQNFSGYPQSPQDPYGIYDGNPYAPPFFSGANAYQGSNPYLNNRPYGANGSAAFPAGQDHFYGQNPYAQNPYGQNPYGQGNPHGQNFTARQNPYTPNPYGQQCGQGNPNAQNNFYPPYGQGNSQNLHGQNFAAGGGNGSQPANVAGQPGFQPINGSGQQPTSATPQGAAQPQPNAAGQATAAQKLPLRNPYAPLPGKSFLTDNIFGKNRLTASAYGILFGMVGANCFYLGKMAGAIISLISFIIGILMQLTWNADVQTTGLLFIFIPEIVNAICGFGYLSQSDEKFIKKIDGSVKLKYLRGLGYRDR